ncbi:hypothetical protein HMPREF9108_00865 [Leptotrichia sp. oral taxon 225 str. F0581]|nr:hypothetical protein HMPREF9108_00865 [Leptotrichia sp. oral taxon 225 str. F0581]
MLFSSYFPQNEKLALYIDVILDIIQEIMWNVYISRNFLKN